MSKYCIVIYWSEIHNRFLAEAPELPGCMADGQTYFEAASNMGVIIEEWIETAKSLGRDIPVPRDCN